MMTRLTARITRALFTADALALVLVLIALQSFVYGISSSLSNTDAKYFSHVCIAAGLIGFGLGKSKLSGIQASAGIAALGIGGVWILGAGLAVPLSAFGRAVLSILPQIIPAIRSHAIIETSPIIESWAVISETSSALTARLQAWFIGVSRNVTVNDALIRGMIWLLIVWLVSAWVGWFARQRNAVLSLMPCIFLLAGVLSYSEYRIESIWTLVVVLLFLMGIWNYRNHTWQWEKHRVDYSDSIRYDLGQAVVLLSIVIGALAFFTPSVSWREIRDFWRNRDQASDNRTAENLGIQKPRSTSQPVWEQKPSLPREHLLSGGYAQSQQIVMTIRTGELPPINHPFIAADAPRYYWRGIIFDEYVGAGWVTSNVSPQKVQAGAPLIPGLLNGYKRVHLDVELKEPEGRIFWSGILYSVDIPFTADWRVRPQSNLFADQAALLQSDMFAAPSDANAYKADAYVPNVSITELRAAGTDYPETIRTRYLSLPPSLPERVRELARQITAGKTNPYEKAKAIESYLRTNYPYDLEVPAPPEGQDVADYFLFDLKKGYCDYYATAMVVLARSSGLPARFVSGYAPGSYDALNAEYIVRELNAHSWAEIYFPEIGWVEFEPTASQPEIERRKIILPDTSMQTQQPAVVQLIRRFHLEQAVYWIAPMSGILFLLLIYFLLIERWLYLRRSPSLAIERIYRRFYRSGRPFAGERTRAETAQEFADRLLDRVAEIRERTRFEGLLSRIHKDAGALTGIYQSTLFVDCRIQKEDARMAWRTWRGLRWRLLFARMLLIQNKTRDGDTNG